jgi:EmrB/QacA subfamily drug resistance transporter
MMEMTHKWWVLAAVACGTFMATLDASIVNIALPTLTKDLNCDLFQVKWVVVIYLLGITCLLLPFGKVADIFGRKPVFQLGFLIFTIGSVLCGLAPTLKLLVLARALQALGVSMLMANGPAIITSAFPANERGAALGTLAMVVSAGLLAGPSIGGILIGHIGWRSIFFINIPVGILGMMLAQRHFPAQERRTPAPFDWAGAFLQCVLLISFIILFDPPNISVSGGQPLPVSRWVIAAVTLFLGAIFLRVEADARAPILDLSLLRNRTFWSANLASFLTFVAYSAVTVLMPFFLEEVMKFSPQTAGLFMTAIPLTIFVVAPLSGRLSDKVGSQELSFSGALIGTIGLFFMSGLFSPGVRPEMGSLEVILSLATIGLATGLFQSPNNNAIMGSVPMAKLGVASALLATVRNLGLVTGTGLATSLFAWRKAVDHDFVPAFHAAFFAAGCVSFLAMLAALAKPRLRRKVIPLTPEGAAPSASPEPGKLERGR